MAAIVIQLDRKDVQTLFAGERVVVPSKIGESNIRTIEVELDFTLADTDIVESSDELLNAMQDFFIKVPSSGLATLAFKDNVETPEYHRMRVASSRLESVIKKNKKP